MNNNDDVLRAPEPPDSGSEGLVPAGSDPLPLPTPEPLPATEPPPMPPVNVEAATHHVEMGPSWRNLGGTSRGMHPESPSTGGGPSDSALAQSPEHADAIATQNLAFVQDATASHDSVTPDGGLAEVACDDASASAAALQLAPEGSVEALPRRESSVTLSRVGEELFAWLKTLASAAVYATLIVTFGFQVARVEGQSMAPTLENQDRLIVNKLAYRLGQPQVGDIVMLYYPLNPDKSFVKRVIAEEGDQIRIVDGRVIRNDVPLNDDYVPPEYRSHDDWGPEVVPQGYYFVMGDHRNNSSDSRHWRFVPKKYIIGKVQLRWWPLPQARIFRSQQ